MVTQIARFSNDCYHIWKAPAGSKFAILIGLILPGRGLGFRVEHFDRGTLRYLYREIFARQHYYFYAKNDNPVVVDCGANVGMASIYFKWLYPNALVQSFEPDPETFKLLQQNVSRNQLDVLTHNCALWDENGELDFFIEPRIPGSLLMSANGDRQKATSIKVRACRLSDFIQGPVDFLKMDVEGAEHRVLTDLVRSGKIGCIRQMLIEYHHRIARHKSALADFLLMLEQAGFEYRIHAGLYPLKSKDVFQDILIAAYRERADRIGPSEVRAKEV